ncbi:hypothetical protein [Aureimonas sp. AU40]|uniref:hypothetical protein n=1 Tax=Aureimonas sp. AU40 TaxID=1637747 RepID=UPI000786579D|nr:hypothetical protein [Aureimonas sp. AU40]
MSHQSCSVLGVALTYLVLVGGAHAQSNEVYLGQVGDTNKLTVDQLGEGNAVGGTLSELRLNQLGNRNVATLLQAGEQNAIGALNMNGQQGFLTGQSGSASGLFQRGEWNTLYIGQRSWRGSGGSLIGAIEQRGSAIPLSEASNSAYIRQIGGAFLGSDAAKGPSSGPGNHSIREISQIYVPGLGLGAVALGTNRIDVTQQGVGQQIGQLRQKGATNRIDIVQDGSSNAVRLADQAGAADDFRLRMTGERNTLGNAEQHGTSDQMSLRLDGTGNFIDQVVQAGLGSQGEGLGNSVFVSVMGNDNGGEGIGGYRAVSSQSAVSGAFASSLEQFGEGNTLSLTIGSDGSGRADGNFFSSVQRGLDNAAYALLTGDGNEFASSQQGDGNRLDIVQASSAIRAIGDNQRAGNTALLQQTGDANLADIRQAGAGNGLDMTVIGNRNLLAVSQTGSANRADVRIVGNDNLRPAPRGGRLPSTTDALVKTILQDGTGHRASLDLVGNDNVVSVLQRGAQNIANGIVRGDENLATVRQEGEKQTLNFIQMGESQSLFVHQQ